MKCVVCDSPNTPERNYCGACGRPLTRYCGLCGFRNQQVDRFCGGCGTSLAEEAVRSAAPAGASVPRPAASSVPGDQLAELLEAAREGVERGAEVGDDRVNQGDIDSLFGAD